MSPSYEMLKRSSRRDIPLIWERGLMTRAQLDEAHTWLNDNFNHRIAALSSSPSSESSLNEIFALIYCEQFELLWMFFFRSYSDYIKGFRVVQRDELGAQFTRCFFWRFDRSMEKVYRVIRKRHLAHDETKYGPNSLIGSHRHCLRSILEKYHRKHTMNRRVRWSMKIIATTIMGVIAWTK